MEDSKIVSYTSLALRLGVGIILLLAGKDHIRATADGMFGKMVLGIYGGLLPVSLAGAIELLLGIALIVGAFTRIAGWISAVFFLNNLVLVYPVFVQMATAGGVPGPLAVLFMMKDIPALGAAIGIGLLGFRDYGIDAYLKEFGIIK